MAVELCNGCGTFLHTELAVSLGKCFGCRSPAPTQLITTQPGPHMADETVVGKIEFNKKEFEDYANNLKRELLPVPKVLDIVPPTTFHQAVEIMLLSVGEDPTRDGLKETPERFRKAWAEMLSGYQVDVAALFKLFLGKYDEMVVVRNITFTSFCEHHLLPFTGVAHVGYVPAGEVVGLSKIARVVQAFAKRLQIQEQLTQQVTEAFTTHLPSAKGSACVIEASHTCMACRGVRVPGATMVTSSLTGVFRDKAEARAEFFACVGRGSS